MTLLSPGDPELIEDAGYKLSKTEDGCESTLSKLGINHVRGSLGTPATLNGMGKLDQLTRVFALADRGAGTARFAEANTFATVARLAEELTLDEDSPSVQGKRRLPSSQSSRTRSQQS